MDVSGNQAYTFVQRVTGSVFTEAEVKSVILEAYRIFCRTTGVLWERSTASGLQDVAATATYTLPTNTLQVERVSYRGRTIYPLRSEQLVDVDALALTNQGTVIGYLLDGDGTSILRKYRVPPVSFASSGNTTAVEFVASANALYSGANSVAFRMQPWMVRYVEFYTISMLLRRNGVAQDLKFADHFQQRYLAGVKRTLQRKSKFLSRRTGVFGSGPLTRTIPIGPRLPWEYGEVVR